MSSPFPRARLAAAAALAALATLVGAGPPAEGTLRVCADPNNLPFSNRKAEGFENRIASVLADELNRRVEYTWWAERRGFLRNTLGSGRCDVVMSVAGNGERAVATEPYYRSTYVFLTRRDRHLSIDSFDDPVLRRLTIGVHFIGDDYQNPPPAHALALRGIVRNVKGYSIYGDYSRPNPPAALVHAVAAGDVDVAIVWGPLAGYFASRERVPLEIRPVVPSVDRSGLPFTFATSLGVRPGDIVLRAQLDQALEARRADIDAILDEYHVPRPPAKKVLSRVAAPVSPLPCVHRSPSS
jgi:quinoprotein dehydrogenase-associated probable ABC transporter substrate-binding protein